MGKKSSKIISQSAPQKKEPLGTGAKFGILVCAIVVAGLGFAIAERCGITGTQFLFRGEIEAEKSVETSVAHSRDPEKTAQTKQTSPRTPRTSPDDNKSTSISSDKKNQADDAKKKTSRKKNAKSQKSSAPAEPLPLHAFIDISRKPHTWPGFIRLTRSRTITMTDSRTGESMGRMEVPKGTVVKVFKVLPTGTLEVFDRTGQKFNVEASGTNFAAAYAAVKNKPKKKSKPKKTVAKTPEKPIEVSEPETSVASAPVKKEKSAPVLSAFGVAFDDDEEWEADSDEE